MDLNLSECAFFLNLTFLFHLPRYFPDSHIAHSSNATIMNPLAALTIVLAAISVSADGPCCQACTVPKEKYYSIVNNVLNHNCGECCMDPKDYKLYHFFEKNLTKADNDSPCAETCGYTKYDSTTTHGFGPVE